MTDIRVPDIGGFADVEVIDVLVKPGQQVEPEEGIITLETDKASMDVPTTAGGTIDAVTVKIGDKVSEGDVIATITERAAASTATQPEVDALVAAALAAPAPSATPEPAEGAGASNPQTVVVPDIGDFKDVEVIDVLVAAGQEITPEEGIITLETDKASIDVPSPIGGVVQELLVKTGDKINQGDAIAVIQPSGGAAAAAPAAQPAATPAPTPAATAAPTPAPGPAPALAASVSGAGKSVYASPAVRKIAREFGVNLRQVKGSGGKGRIIKEDVQAYVRVQLNQPSATTSGGMDMGWTYVLPRQEDEDFSKYGPVEQVSLARIRQLSGPALHRNWLTGPHVTQFDDADVTDLEKFRQAHSAEAKERGFSLSPLAFIVKAISVALEHYSEFNSSLVLDGKSLIIKKYCHIGIAVDTPGGLMVPVMRDVDTKSVMQLAEEMATLSKKTREGKVGPKELRGGCFTISSLGGIGGSHFTPIINVPEVAILGVGKSRIQPVWNGKEFMPRSMMPLSLSYDHRVIDGANGARFITHLSLLLSDIRNIVL